ncbi:putative calcium-binding protein CML23 [Asparagus officinalis]|uniref:putative calcium-binding protein CML23 n=1 Tax=Asparagus officinalis TaxID=4686 RepID=UPI00098E2FCE|nr:putative calcium-binding protein CML23 [Asparagus officinalis]
MRNNELKRLFHQLDENGDGKISPSELQNCLRLVGEELSTDDVEGFMVTVNEDGHGLLRFDDFIKLLKIEEGGEEEHRFLWEAFRVYEMEGEGCITPKSLRKTLEKLGQLKTVEECREMIRRYDVNGDGVLCFDEFKKMMLRT